MILTPAFFYDDSANGFQTNHGYYSSYFCTYSYDPKDQKRFERSNGAVSEDAYLFLMECHENLHNLDVS